ncbi:MAG: hypothetical protein FJX03_02755 [Alphaproteobacteria bacterium]|nr:hypothetical protein [Alphaproteobacteria bacterium]
MVSKGKFVLGLLASVLAVSFAVGKIGTGSENLAPSLLESKEPRTAGAESKGENTRKKETSGLARVLDNSSSSGTKETTGASEGLTHSSSLGTKETTKQANPTEVSGGLGGVGTSGSTGIRETSGTTGTAENLGSTATSETSGSSSSSGSTAIKEISGTSGEGATSPASAKESLEGIDDTILARRINKILTDSPEMIVAALQKFNQAQHRIQQEKLDASLVKYKDEISKDSSAIVLGKKDAEIKLVVFLDPNCPHCRPFSQALTKVSTEHPNVAIFVRQWPILGPDSEEVARGLWAIKQQGSDKFNAITKAIAASEDRYTFAKLLLWVTDHKLDVTKFKKDFESQATKDIVDNTKKLALDIGLEGTPTSLLVSKKGIRVVSPTDEKSLQSILTGAAKDGSDKT